MLKYGKLIDEVSHMQLKPKYRKEHQIKLCYNKKYVQSLPVLLHSQIRGM